MDRETKQRLGEIRSALHKYGFDKILGETAKSKLTHNSEETHELLDSEIPVKLRMMFQELGTTYIKLGQLLSTRSDLVGEDIANEMAKLQDDNPAISYNEVKKIVERELDGNIDELFEDFQEEHLATASIGQVHEAHLITGERVAVKIQKTGITEKIDLDIRIMKYIAEKADKLNDRLKKLNLPGMMEEFDRSIHQEIDYNNEMMNMKRMEANFSQYPKIHIPITYDEYCTPKVLTMEFIDGTRLADVYDDTSDKFDKELLADNTVKSYLKQIFLDGFFHGDPHPGNIMILEDNVLCYLDLGMMGSFDDNFRKNLSELMILVADQDIDGIINQLMYMDIIDYDLDTRFLKRDLNDLFGKYYGAELKRMNGLFEELIKLMQDYDIVLPNELVTMARGLSMIESVAKTLNPEIDVFVLMEPMAKKIIRSKADPRHLFKSKKSNAILYGHMLKSMPQLLTRTIHKIEEGELKFKFEIDRLDYLTNKILITLLISALLISSSLVMTITRGPMLWDMPFIGVIGYIITLILSIFAIVKYVVKT